MLKAGMCYFVQVNCSGLPTTVIKNVSIFIIISQTHTQLLISHNP